ncbi:MAG: hypothetical protein KDA83_11790 [Planctomycetales bacterium]|nr:hypothetical protein [Planctomycetales bacterium]
MNRDIRSRSLATAILATARFEFERSLSAGRLSVMACLALFPPCITLISILGQAASVGQFEQAVDVFIAVTCYIVCVLASLIWSTTVVTAELEGKTWAYSASRPGGRIAIAIGKYLVSCFWTAIVTTLAITASLMVRSVLIGGGNELQTWLVLVSAGVAATVAYGSVFLLLGAIFQRRAMVAAIVYGLLFEGIIAAIPAVISNLTVRYPLTYLVFRGLLPDNILKSDFFTTFYSDYGILNAIIALAGIILITFSVAIALIRYREFITSDEA